VRTTSVFVILTAALTVQGGGLFAQAPQVTPVVPKLIRISSAFHPANGLPASPVESITVSIYREENGGSPLWSETQNVDVSPDGKYTVLMGSTLPDGVPSELFATAEPRWLGVCFNRSREVEQPRTLLVSVPYALRAGDADTLGGRPASAFLLADAANSAARAQPANESAVEHADPRISPRSPNAKPRTSGIQNCISVFTDPTNLGCSNLWQAGTNIGMGTPTPQSGIDIAAGGVAIRGVNYTSGGPALELNMPLPNLAQIASVIGSTRAVNGIGIWGNPVSFYGGGGLGTPLMTLLSSGNVGVGNASPLYRLDVAGPIRSSSGGFVFPDGTSQTTAATSGGGSNSPWASASSSIYYNGGNVGIGTQNPAAPLAVSGGTTGSARFGLVDENISNTTRGVSIKSDATVAIAVGQTTGASVGLLWANNGSPAAGFGELYTFGNANPMLYAASFHQFQGRVGIGATPGNSAALYVNGNVGVGNASPLYKLDVAGPIRSSSGGFVFPDGTTQSTAATSGGGGNSPWVGSGSSIYYVGNVGVGTSSPAYKLDVAGDINFAGALRYQGVPALQVVTTGGTTAIGYQALQTITTGTNDTATGYKALALNTSGIQNTANGAYSLFLNTSGSYNTGFGYGALQSNTTGGYNTAIGYNALADASGTGYNTAIGSGSLSVSTTGADNTAAGYSALGNNTTGGQNTAVGEYSLKANTTGYYNTALGNNALYYAANGNNNIAVGYQAGYLVGIGGGTSNNYNIHIGSEGTAADNATIRIGTPGTQTSFYAAGIFGTNVSGGAPVYVNSNGQLGIQQSSRRFKEDIQDMGDGSRGLMHLRPVTFHYKQAAADGSKPLQYGLIAEEVAKIYPDLVVRSADGQIETVNYQALDAMLVNEVRRQQAEIEAQAARIRSLEHEIDNQHREGQALAERLARLDSCYKPEGR